MKKNIIFFVIRALVSVALIGFILLNLGKENLQSFPGYLQNASYPFLFISILFFAVAVTITTIRWKRLLEVQDVKLSFIEAFQLTFIGFFFSNFLPGTLGGDAVKLYYIAKHTRKNAGSLASILIDRVIGMSALIFIAIPVVLLNFRYPVVKNLSPLVFGLFAFFLIASFLFFNLKNTFLLTKLFKIRLFGIGDKIANFKKALVLYRKSKTILAFALSVSVIIQLLVIFVCYFLSKFLNLNIPIVYLFLFIPIIQLIVAIPVTVSGIGTREVAFVFFFATTAGIIPKMDAFALSIVFYLVMVATSLIGGVVYLFKGGELKK